MRSVTRDSIRYNRLVLDRDALLAELNPPQRDAVTAGDGPLLVLAGAGSGETRVIAHRIAWLLGVCGVHPKTALAVTFSNKAAGEMARRVEELVAPVGIRAPLIATFHSACVRILRQHIRHIGYPPHFTIYDEDDRLQLVKECLRELDMTDRTWTPASIVQQITAGHRNVCVVGDADQSIYKWRGADIRNILDFETDYPGTRVIRLEQNYRSTKRILALASAVIAHNVSRKDKGLWTENGEGERAAVYRAWDEHEEANFVAQTILAARGAGSAWDDIAVFYRTNAQSRVLEDALRRGGIPYVVVGSVRFYERKEIKDALAYLRLVVNPADDVAFRRAIQTPGRGIGRATLTRLEELAVREARPLLALAAAPPADVTGKPRRALEEFAALITRLATAREKTPLPAFIDLVLDASGYR